MRRIARVATAASRCGGPGARGEPNDVQCPFCKADDDKVIDSRSASEGAVIRRRRACLACERRFTTYERIEQLPLRVVKKDGSRVPFDRQKILNGLLKACEKRPVATDTLEEIATSVEAETMGRFDREVDSKTIGEFVIERMRSVDEVAYIRFASVYREFKDVNEFVEEVRPMLRNPT